MNINVEKNIRAGQKRNKRFSAFLGKLLGKPVTNLQAKASEEAELLEALKNARNEWLDVSASFEHVKDEELVDYYTFKMKACESRYAYFLKKAKEFGIKSIEFDKPTAGSSLSE